MLGRVRGADRNDLVVRPNPRAGGGSSVDGRHHLDEPVAALGDLDAEAVELALGIDLHLFVRVSVEERGVGIQLQQHAVDSASQQRLFVDGLHIMTSNVGEHAREETQLFVVTGGETADVVRQAPRETRRDGTRQEGEEKANSAAPHGINHSSPLGWPGSTDADRGIDHRGGSRSRGAVPTAIPSRPRTRSAARRRHRLRPRPPSSRGDPRP